MSILISYINAGNWKLHVIQFLTKYTAVHIHTSYRSVRNQDTFIALCYVEKQKTEHKEEECHSTQGNILHHFHIKF
jgi:hypothetical protein